MKETLITFETAKLAKDKGFNNKGLYFYKGDKEVIGPFAYDNLHPKEIVYSAPTQSLLQKWLREEYNMHLIIKIDQCGDYQVEIQNVELPNGDFEWFDDYLTYEEALEKGLQEAIELI